MSILVIVQLKVTDQNRFKLYRDSFFDLRPDTLVTVSWDSSPAIVVGEPLFDHVGVAAFAAMEELQTFMSSPEYHNLSVMREACSTAHVQVVHTPVPIDALRQGGAFFATKDTPMPE